MRYLIYTYVDRQSGRPVTEVPASAGPVPPAIAGLTFSFALESRYPTEAPVFYGTADDDADVSQPGVLALVDEATFNVARATELDARRARRLAELATARYRRETAGVAIGETRIDTSRDSQALITGAYCTALLNPSVRIDWKGADGGWTQIDAGSIAAIAAAVSAHVQACFSRERVLAELIGAAPTFAELAAVELESGWPP